MTYRLPLVLLLSVLLMPLAPALAAAPAPILVCYPGGPVAGKDAQEAMNAMLRVVERVGQWPANSFNSTFTNNTAECKTLLAEKNPGFAITSLGLFLEQRNRHNLVPVIQPRIKGSTTERYRVLVQKGKYESLDRLKGKSLGGTVLEEPDFIGRIVFAGKYDPAAFFDLKPSRQAVRALRSLDTGELDAVILNGQQFAGLESLQLTTSLEPIFTSQEIPLMGVVANSKTTTADQRARFAKSLAGMCADPEGQKLCSLFGIESFVPVDPAVFEPMIKLWNEGN